MKKVSVLIPVYNCERYVAEAIESVLNQTYTNIEVIIVDDGSTDNSLKIARSYERKNVKVYSQSHSGAPRARNHAFEKSTGDYIQYLDADDLLAPDKIDTQVKLLEQNCDNCITFCSHSRDFNDFSKGIYLDQEINKDYINPVELFLDIFNNKGNIITMCWLIPRVFVLQAGPWDENLIKAQDGEFFVKAALKSKMVIFSQNTIVYYRYTGFNITVNQDKRALESVILSTGAVQNTIFKYENSERVKKALVNLWSGIFCTYYPGGDSLLLNRIEMYIKALGGKLKYSGNKYFGMLAGIIGIKNALMLKAACKKIFK